MGKSLLAAAIEQLKALQKEAATLRSTAGVTPAQLDEMDEKLSAQSKLIAELEEQEKSGKTAAKLPKEVFAAVKANILELNPKSKDHQKAVAALDIDECEIVSKKGSTFVVHAGKYGMRKVTV